MSILWRMYHHVNMSIQATYLFPHGYDACEHARNYSSSDTIESAHVCTLKVSYLENSMTMVGQWLHGQWLANGWPMVVQWLANGWRWPMVGQWSSNGWPMVGQCLANGWPMVGQW